MRKTVAGLTAHAIPGTRSVQFGFDATEEARRGLLGFAIGRRVADGSVRWKNGYKFFPSVIADPEPGETRSTAEHPIQDFQWGEYSVEPGETYDFVFAGVYGPPAAPRLSPEIELRVTTSNPDTSRHGIYFNRGAIPSQAFAKRFGNEGPGPRQQDDPDNDKVRWLSRGLLEAALAFIGQANGPRFELRVGAYEFSYHPILLALAEAAGTGATVRVSFHGGNRIGEDYVRPESVSCLAWDAIRKAKLLSSDVDLIPRTRFSKIPHNKFMVLLDNGRPVEVWTGSTNFTASGFLGQCNVGHVVRDEAVAQVYNDYWEALARDPGTRDFKDFTNALTPTPGAPLPADAAQVMVSPRERGMMDWYADQLGATASSAMFTAAFGVEERLAARFAEDRDYLRFILMEREDRRPEIMEQLLADREDTKIALGEKLNAWTIRQGLPGHRLDQWFREEEHFRKRGHIFYVHTKFMILDALTDDPKLFTGSANFSEPSVTGNDENMLLLRGPSAREAADIYAIEFMRMFRHMYFRTVAVAVARRRADALEAGQTPEDGPAIVHLAEDDSWTDRHFDVGSYKDKLRRLWR